MHPMLLCVQCLSVTETEKKVPLAIGWHFQIIL